MTHRMILHAPTCPQATHPPYAPYAPCPTHGPYLCGLVLHGTSARASNYSSVQRGILGDALVELLQREPNNVVFVRKRMFGRPLAGSVRAWVYKDALLNPQRVDAANAYYSILRYTNIFQ